MCELVKMEGGRGGCWELMCLTKIRTDYNMSGQEENVHSTLGCDEICTVPTKNISDTVDYFSPIDTAQRESQQ